ncbi:unnamed protein product, partial [Trichobilharzia szidati]
MSKKMPYINVAFKGDLLAAILKRKISNALKATFSAPTLRLIFPSRQLFFNNSKDKLSHLTTSMCSCQFTCSYGARYKGRSEHVLSKAVKKHYLTWLRKRSSGSIRSATIEHIFNIGHSMNVQDEFIQSHLQNQKKPAENGK